MRRIPHWLIIGLIAVGAVVVLAVIRLGTSTTASIADAETYAKASIRDISADWSPGALIARASPDLRRTVDGSELPKAFAFLSRLGTLRQIGACEGRTTSTVGIGAQNKTTANVRCAATYSAGPATATLDLVKAGGTWALDGFNLNSPALIP